ncbi:MAG: L-2-amino-thiazoline-4-carboxylic acid hydrolase, partial [Chloroflexi bacterium]|nr:L-2-amino-thiazoline-4-carboxylic acid hydrolase [Chloroflexota bacterium]
MLPVGERRKKLPLKWPYAKAVETARDKALNRRDFDPAVLVVWGQMQAMGLLAMLKAVESQFGAQGQEVCRKAISSVGHDVVNQMLDNVDLPKDLSDIEIVSLFYTWINEVPYASVEDPAIDSADECHFEIIYCPHEDTYGKFDCRIQRYFVEGMIEAAKERLGHDKF